MKIGLVDVDGHNLALENKDFQPRKGFTCNEYFKDR